MQYVLGMSKKRHARCFFSEQPPKPTQPHQRSEEPKRKASQNDMGKGRLKTKGETTSVLV